MWLKTKEEIEEMIDELLNHSEKAREETKQPVPVEEQDG